MRPGTIILATALLLAGAAPAHAQSDPKGMLAFIEQVYAGYPRHTPRPEGEFDAMFDRSMRELIDRNDSYGPDLVPPLNFDPICQCQDDSGFTHKLESLGAWPGRGTVTVTNIFGPPARPLDYTVVYSLVHEDGAWRISDIESVGMPSMKEWLRAELDKPRE